MKRIFWISLAFAAWAAVAANPARAQTIEVSYIEVQHEISPGDRIARVPRSFQLTLSGNNSIHVDSTTKFGAGSSQRSYDIKPGSVFRAGSGDTAGSTIWKVQDKNTLVATGDTASGIKHGVVKLTGATSCSAAITYQLKPGAKAFSMQRFSTGQPMLVGDLHAENVVCRIR
jgi:hypothetical protein